MLNPAKFIDPRRQSIPSFVSAVMKDLTPTHVQSECLKILAGSRDAEALRRINALTPPKGGLSYTEADLAKRSTNRINRALAKARQFSSRPFKSALDVGCARGENADPLRDAGVAHYTGLDIDPSYFPVPQANERFLCASAEDIPLEDNSVDLALSFNVFEHVQSPSAALDEIVRVLKKGGMFRTSFGPPFNGASGPHLTRRISLPYVHHFFDEEVVAKFTGRRNAYYTVNRLPVKYYRDIFFKEKGFKLLDYKEQINGDGFWLLKEHPDVCQRLGLDELSPCAIHVLLEKV